MKNRTIIGIICMLLAVAVCFGVAPLLNKASAAKVDVVCVTADIPQGRIITEDNIKIVTVGAYNLSPKVIKDKNQVIGRYAACDLKTDALLLEAEVTNEANGAEDVFKSLDGSKQAISITLDGFAGGLSGKLKNGDIVSVIITDDNKTAIPAELKYVRIITTTSSSGNDAGEMESTELPSTVTLLVNDIQATLLAKSEANGKLHLSLVYRGSEENAVRFLNAQDTVFSARGKVSENE